MPWRRVAKIPETGLCRYRGTTVCNPSPRYTLLLRLPESAIPYEKPGNYCEVFFRYCTICSAKSFENFAASLLLR